MVGLARTDSTYYISAYAELLGYVGYAHSVLSSGPNSQNRFSGDVGSPMIDAIVSGRIGFSSALYAVLHVFDLRSLPKMIRVNASRVVAGVENKQIRVKRSISRKKRHSVCELFVPVTKVTDANHSVSFVVNLTSPLPTSVRSRLVDFIPKSFTEHMGKLMYSHAHRKGLI